MSSPLAATCENMNLDELKNLMDRYENVATICMDVYNRKLEEQFHHFEDLPAELQEKILAENVLSSQLVSTTAKALTDRYVSQKCNETELFTKKELDRIMKNIDLERDFSNRNNDTLNTAFNNTIPLLIITSPKIAFMKIGSVEYHLSIQEDGTLNIIPGTYYLTNAYLEFETVFDPKTVFDIYNGRLSCVRNDPNYPNIMTASYYQILGEEQYRPFITLFLYFLFHEQEWLRFKSEFDLGNGVNLKERVLGTSYPNMIEFLRDHFHSDIPYTSIIDYRMNNNVVEI